MQHHKPDHPCLQAVPVLPLEAIFDEPDQIPTPVEKYKDEYYYWIEERCGKNSLPL